MATSEHDRLPPWVPRLLEDGPAARLYCRLHGLMAALGALFLVVVVSERVVPASSGADEILRSVGLVLWALFGLEFLVRLLRAEGKARFLRKNWWQLFLLALPFLNVLRAGAALRITRLGRVVSASLRGTRSARSRFTGRLGWLLTTTVVVVLLTTDVVYELAGIRPYGRALHDVALATLTGEPMGYPSGLTQVLEVALAAYSAIFFAAFAATFGSFLLERHREEQDRS